MNKQEQEQEQLDIINKFFNYAESPIKEWIAKYLQKDIMEVFPDYQDNSDILGFQSEISNEYFVGYILPMEKINKLFVDTFEMEKSNNYKKALSMLYDSVNHVFTAVVNTASKDYIERLKFIRPMFIEKYMAFQMCRINSSATKLKYAYEMVEEAKKNNISPDDKNIQECMKIINDLSEEKLNQEESLCIEENQKLKDYDLLYLVVDNDVKKYADEAHSRLITFGAQYCDPGEDEISKLTTIK